MPANAIPNDKPLAFEWADPFKNHIFVTTRHTHLPLALDQMGISNHPFARMHQTHSSNVATITSPSTPEDGMIWHNDIDALITNQPIGLIVKTADCLPILISHTSGWKAGIHAGRVGTEKKITMKTIQHLVQATGSSSGYWVWFGPRICKECYQIDPITDARYNLVQENQCQLDIILGSDGYHLLDTGECTVCKNDTYFSYRNEKTTERIFSGIY
jgi:hypothetical protein